MYRCFLVFLFAYLGIFSSCNLLAQSRLLSAPNNNTPRKVKAKEPKKLTESNVFSWRENVWTTTFWIGQSSLKSVPGSSCNKKSAWERNWVDRFGGYDHPKRRNGFRPSSFVPKQNTFYVALPYNDLVNPEEASKLIPWWQDGKHRWTSQVKGRWLAIEHNGRVAFAQWKDVGPWITHDPDYVFGGKKHRARAGLDVSPAVRDYLGLNGSGITRWRFVEQHEVPDGPWLSYGDVKKSIMMAREEYLLKEMENCIKHTPKNEKSKLVVLKVRQRTSGMIY